MTASATSPTTSERHVNGYLRADGRVGTRNFIGVFVAGNCAATAARRIAEWFNEKRLSAFPDVDGVVPFTHELGCGMEKSGEPMDLLRRTIGGSVRSPNLAGAVVLALGCERNNIYAMLEQEGLSAGAMLRTVVLQEVGGTAKAIEAGILAVQEMLPAANASPRRQVPAARLVVGLQGSSSGSATTEISRRADRVLGCAVDLLMEAGGTALVSATHTNAASLQQRAATTHVAQSLGERIVWWDKYTSGRDVASTPSRDAPGYAGSTQVQAVIGYAHPIPPAVNGLVMMDAPSYEAISATGQVASGANLVCVLSQDGSAFGATGAPTVKVAGNSVIFEMFEDDLDFDAGVDTESVEAAGERLFALWLRVASGEQTCSESLGVGDEQFVPWPIGVLA